MAARSAGILMYHWRGGEPFVLLVHPGGPYWANKDLGAWSIPKGEYEPGEDLKLAALREFQEELGVPLNTEPVPLGEIVQKGGKHVTAFVAEGELDIREIVSNTFEIEWPPRSGKRQSFPEVDRAGWFSVGEGRTRILPSQLAFLDMLAAYLSALPATEAR